MRKQYPFRFSEDVREKLRVPLAVRGLTFNDLILQGLQLACDKNGIKLKIK